MDTDKAAAGTPPIDILAVARVRAHQARAALCAVEWLNTTPQTAQFYAHAQLESIAASTDLRSAQQLAVELGSALPASG